ncbi:hypothetical protein [uncultured Microbacterium sp.]|uniref:hypothetical protein n=1 Tax=uncultured Microbacterium sp. TaxID=191216 RepID=UPI0028DD131D|nr:hypothetical protein [uncultured Microbacterium sp.]
MFVLFDDPEALLVSYLRTTLPTFGIDLPVSTDVPRGADGHPLAAYVRVRLLGGGQRDTVIDEALFAIENHFGIDEDSVEASRVASLIRALVTAMPDRVPAVRRVRETSRPTPRHHPDTGAPSYSQSHQLTTRGTMPQNGSFS